MIARMTKYSFIVYQPELGDFLEKVQELGMVDTRRENKAVDNHSKELLNAVQSNSLVIKKLKELKESLTEVTPPESGLQTDLNAKEVFKAVESSLENRDIWIAEEKSLIKELEESVIWGSYNKEDIHRLESLGYKLHFYCVSENNFNPEWDKEYLMQVLNKEGGKYYFVILSPVGADFLFKHPESRFPQNSFDIVEQKLKEVRNNISNSNSYLAGILKRVDFLEKALDSDKSVLDLYLAGISSQIEAEGTLALITGFAPESNKDELKQFFDKENVYYIAEDAHEDDNPPIKLKNNFFTRLFEPIGDLYMLPRYGELDLTPYFAPFYMLFFGLCLGDIGYGLVLLIVGTIGKLKLAKFKEYLTLVQLLGIGSIIMPLLTGSIFGTKLGVLFPLPDSINSLFFSDIKMFWFAIVFGILQIVFARIINAIFSIVTKGWQYGMHNIGWAIVIVWASMSYAKTMVPGMVIPPYVNYIGMFGCLLILFFSATEGNIITRILKGTFAFYDITGVFGDVLSYIRLFGLGTSGGILGYVVNSIAMNMYDIPYVGWFFTALMLLVGHTFVLLLSSLGAFVHPMRLTFVEFYKNSGFTGGGKAFRPLTKN